MFIVFSVLKSPIPWLMAQGAKRPCSIRGKSESDKFYLSSPVYPPPHCAVSLTSFYLLHFWPALYSTPKESIIFPLLLSTPPNSFLLACSIIVYSKSWKLSRSYCELGSGLCTLFGLSHLFFIVVLWGRYYYFHVYFIKYRQALGGVPEVTELKPCLAWDLNWSTASIMLEGLALRSWGSLADHWSSSADGSFYLSPPSPQVPDSLRVTPSDGCHRSDLFLHLLRWLPPGRGSLQPYG